jgi:hypothetical protein
MENHVVVGKIIVSVGTDALLPHMHVVVVIPALDLTAHVS